jgi:hypothetical protein
MKIDNIISPKELKISEKILNKLDNIISKNKENLSKLRNIKESIMGNGFIDPQKELEKPVPSDDFNSLFFDKTDTIDGLIIDMSNLIDDLEKF